MICPAAGLAAGPFPVKPPRVIQKKLPESFKKPVRVVFSL
jgi:hypothetical protein